MGIDDRTPIGDRDGFTDPSPDPERSLVPSISRRAHDESVTVLAIGSGTDGCTWELDVSGDRRELVTMVNVTLADGQTPWGTGCAGPPVYPGSRLNVCTGSADEGPRTFIARVTPDVRAVVVMLSDGTREDLVLHRDVDSLGARIGVLVYPRELDIHRVDLADNDGSPLPEHC